jgi:putative MFS transporter
MSHPMSVVTRRDPSRTPHVGITFHHPPAFWVGTTAIAIGVVLHLPMFFSAAPMAYRLVGMPMSHEMLVGMALIVGGILLAGWGLFPRRADLGAPSGVGDSYHLKVMDDATLRGAHWGLLFVLGIALIVDVMKPATLGFVIPGMKAEYELTALQVSIFPISALTGTVVGSIFWGVLADRLGRRAAILLSSIMFIGTAICGAMPGFGWNVFMCFIMGAAAGGMLPIVYALMAESVPAKKRGWLVVLHGGMGTVGGYLAASGAAALLEPHFGWRILWFLNLPTGLLMLWLNRWIPESPRFLLHWGRIDDARGVMARYGVTVEPDAVPTATPAGGSRLGGYAEVAQLFTPALLPRTVTVLLYGLGWGIVNWGFITFLPTAMRQAGIGTGRVSGLLFLSSLIAVPGTVLVAYLYGLWSSRRTMIVYAVATGAALLAFALVDPTSRGNHLVLIGLVVALLVSSGGVISMLSPYTAEIYPTHLRGTGSGFAAASSKLGGVFGPPIVASLLATTGTLTIPALASAVPVIVAAVALAVRGVETRGRRLEELSAEGHGAPRRPERSRVRERP